MNITLTGEQRKRRYGVIIDGKTAWLSRRLFTAFLQLVQARACCDSEFVVLSPVVVWRLRLEIENVIGPKQVIATGAGGAYALVVEKHCVFFTAGFRGCPLPNRLMELRAAILRSLPARTHQRT